MSEELRPLAKRLGARVLVVAGDDILLVRDRDPGVPDSQWWVLPGGGLDEGEDPKEGALRELREETGLVGAELVGPIGTRTVTHGYSDRILVQDEWFFRTDVDWFMPAPLDLSDSETERGIIVSWVPIDLLHTMTVWPSDMDALLEATVDDPVAFGDVEESTVPVRPLAPDADVAE